MKKVISCIAFCLLLVLLVGQVNEILVPKSGNRYYMLDAALEELDEEFDVHVYGACHSYTSFHPAVLEEVTGLTSFDMGNSGEIVPVTYLRMKEYFKKDAPQVALVEVWGIFPYETYSSHYNIFEYYMPNNLQQLPLSLAKLEVIMDYESVGLLDMNLHISRYKDRIMDGALTDVDFDYRFEAAKPYCSSYTQVEMTQRLSSNGFCEMPMWEEDSAYDPYMDVTDFYSRQPVVSDEEKQELEADIVKYIDKIIDLCEKNDVELIFYRAPYLSRASELRKANWFADYCESRGILFLDLEEEMEFDLSTDFLDYHHLNASGARKATMFLSEFILDVME